MKAIEIALAIRLTVDIVAIIAKEKEIKKVLTFRRGSACSIHCQNLFSFGGVRCCRPFLLLQTDKKNRLVM